MKYAFIRAADIVYEINDTPQDKMPNSRIRPEYAEQTSRLRAHLLQLATVSAAFISFSFRFLSADFLSLFASYGMRAAAAEASLRRFRHCQKASCRFFAMPRCFAFTPL